MPGRQRPLAERFAAKVNKTADCWLWTGYRQPNGYGQIGLGGRGDGSALAHRVSYELETGQPIPDGMVVMHKCDTPACIRFEHLTLGTQAENMADKVRKGRHLWRKTS